MTKEGRKIARRLSTARAVALKEILQDLSAPERTTLHSLMGRLMASLVHTKDTGAWICRLCDLSACGRSAGLCPAANAAAVKHAPG